MPITFRIFFPFLICFLTIGCHRQVANNYSNPGKPRDHKGEWDKYYEWKSSKKKIYPTELQRKTMVDSFNYVPKSIAVVEQVLDTTVLSSLCYKFIYSLDSSKFLAFYLTAYKSDDYEFMTRNGDAVIYHDYEKKDTQTLYYGVVAMGMEYKGKWYYARESSHVFYGNNLKEAQADFLFYYLNDEWFFDKWLTPAHSFWETGGKSIRYLPLRRENYLSVYPEFEGFPILVAFGASNYVRMNEKKCKLWIKRNLERIQSTDTFSFNQIYTDHLDLHGDLFNKSASKIIVSIINKDSRNTFYLTFFYFQLNNDSIVSVNRLNKSIETDSSRQFVTYKKSKINFFKQFIPEFKFSNPITKSEDFWNDTIPELIGQPLQIDN